MSGPGPLDNRPTRHFVGEDERTRTADPLLAEHLRREAVTCIFAHAEQEREMRVPERLERAQRTLRRYISGTPGGSLHSGRACKSSPRRAVCIPNEAQVDDERRAEL